MIGVDWGTSTFRAFRIGADGRVIGRIAAARGILHVEDGDFAGALRAQIGPWLVAGESRVLLSGMIGSRQGWVEAAYLPCPAGIADLAGALVAVPFEDAEVRLVPGVSASDESGTPEVMRGEETQIVGVIETIGEAGLVCLPGSHSKWVRIAGGRIAGYLTCMTGEAYGALSAHTILGRMLREAGADDAAFDRGVARSGEPGGLLHHLFGVRTLGLAGQLTETSTGPYLSGLLLGHEIRAVRAGARRVHLVGAAALCALYARAIAALGGEVAILDQDAAARGLARLGKEAKWS